MKNAIRSYSLAEDAKLFRSLADKAWAKYDEEALEEHKREALYFEDVASRLDSLAWDYASLIHEGLLEDWEA